MTRICFSYSVILQFLSLYHFLVLRHLWILIDDQKSYQRRLPRQQLSNRNTELYDFSNPFFGILYWYIMDQNLVWSRSKASSGLLHWWACSPNPRHLEPRGFAEISPTPGNHRHIYAPLLYMKHLRVYASPGNRMYEVYMAAVLSLAWGLEDWASAWW